MCETLVAAASRGKRRRFATLCQPTREAYPECAPHHQKIMKTQRMPSKMPFERLPFTLRF